MDRGSGPARPGSEHSGHDNAVVPALAALVPLTSPTAAERARIRERVLAGLSETAEAETASPVAVAEDDKPATAGPASSTATTGTVVRSTGRVRPPRHRVASWRAARASRGPRGRRGSTPGGGGSERPARPVSGARARFAVAAVAVLALVGSLAGMSLLLARDALPGDALYGVKRTTEAASLGLTFGEESRALKHLDFAGARISEIETLTRRYPDGDGAPAGGYLSALTDFDNDAAAGSRQLIAMTTPGDGSRLELLRTWAQQQQARLAAVTLPSAVRARESASDRLLGTIVARTDALLARIFCRQVTADSSDEVGALPATGECVRVPGAGPASQAPGQPVPGGPGPGTPPGVGGTVAPAPRPPEPAPAETEPPLIPLPGVTDVLPADPAEPAPGDDPAPESPVIELPLPLPLPSVEVPPLLPGVPGVSIG